MYTLSFLGPLFLSVCLDGLISMGNGFVCNIDMSKPEVVKYPQQKEESCYRDEIFYPRCKDLENPEVLYYHNLFKSKK